MRHLALRSLLIPALLVAPLVVACGEGEPAGPPDAAPVVEDLDLKAEDFECILRWEKVRRFRITNKLGHLDQALAVAASPEGGVYPVGTIIQLVPFEAMVKRRPGFHPDSKDWEFFALEVSAAGTTIVSRGGGSQVLNQFNGQPCLDCHAGAEPKWDLVCEDGHGCERLPIDAEVIEGLQNGDARCP